MTKSYKDFPPYYFTLLEHFVSDNSEQVFTLPARDAYSRRSDFHRFKKSLCVGADGGDTYAEYLYDIFQTLIISIRPGKARDDEPVQLVIYLDPLAVKFGATERRVMRELPQRPVEEPVVEETKAPVNDRPKPKKVTAPSPSPLGEKKEPVIDKEKLIKMMKERQAKEG